MQEKSDAQLLREYAELTNESAFREIVVRHTDLVYSSALRQVASPDQARDVAQSVFTDLARKARSLAGKMSDDQTLAGWLYRSTRYAVLTFLRDDRRRQARERQVMEYLDPASEISLDWTLVRPVLDEAMANLTDEDRDALLLRFFKNQDFRAVGMALGVSDDAAQKRVTRALEKLRAYLKHRGVTASAAALSTVLSANAVQSAPVGLAATLTSVSLAGSAAGTGTTLTLLKFMAATKLKTGIISAIVVASVVTLLVIQRQVQARLRDQEEALRRRADQVTQLQSENERLANPLQARTSRSASNVQFSELLKLRGDVTRLRKDIQELTQPKAAAPLSRTEMLASMANLYSERVGQLKQLLEANPSEKIPELQFLTDDNWLWLANRKTLDTEDARRRAMSTARQMAEENFVSDLLKAALQKFAHDNNGQFPSDLSQLKPYWRLPIDSLPIDEAIVQRWAIVPVSKLVKELRAQLDEDWFITQKTPVNAALDQRILCGLKQVHSFADGPPNFWDVAR